MRPWLTAAVGVLVLGMPPAWGHDGHESHRTSGVGGGSVHDQYKQQIAAMEAQLRAIREQIREQEERLSLTAQTTNQPPGQGQREREEKDRSQSVEGAFPGAKIPSRPKDILPRSGAEPLDVPRGLEETVDPQKAAVLQQRSLMSRFNPAFGVVINTVGGYNQRTLRYNQGNGPDAGQPVGTRWPSGFHANLQDLEMFAAADVDTFARAYAVVTGHAEGVDQRGEENFGKAVLHVEEAAIQTTSLPYNLSIRAGRFFADFGYLPRRHSHDLPFVDRPPTLAQMFSEAQADGVEVTWLAPTPIYLKFNAAYASRFGEVVEDPLSFFRQQVIQGNTFLGKVTTYYDLTDDHNVELGLSVAHAPQSRAVAGTGVVEGDAIERSIYDLDFHYRWYPLGRGLRQSLSIHGEILYDTGQGRRDVFGNTVRQGAWGGYVYAEYRLSKQWRPGFRFDYHQEPTEPALVANPLTGAFGSTVNLNGNRTDVRTYSPYITWYLSEFNRLLLQYNRTERGNASDSHAVLLSWNVVLGSHVHGFTERD